MVSIPLNIPRSYKKKTPKKGEKKFAFSSNLIFFNDLNEEKKNWALKSQSHRFCAAETSSIDSVLLKWGKFVTDLLGLDHPAENQVNKCALFPILLPYLWASLPRKSIISLVRNFTTMGISKFMKFLSRE